MARLFTSGFETGALHAEGFTSTGSVVIGGGGRTGVKSVAIGTGVSVPAYAQFAFTGATATSYFARACVQFFDHPPSNVDILTFLTGAGTALGSVRLKTNGTLVLWNNVGAAEVGSSSAAVDHLGIPFYRLELRVRINASTNDDLLDFYLDDVLLGSTSTANLGTTAPGQLRMGVQGALSNVEVMVDDVALNDSTGSFQNTWPGDGKVVMLLPVSDNSAGSWRAGSAASAAANGALYAAIDNAPPTGTVSPNAVGNAISNTISGATAPNGDFNMTSWATAGVGATDTINVAQQVAVHGEDIATGTKTGTIEMVSPAIAAGAVFNFGADIGAVSTYPTNWTVARGTPTYVLAATMVSQLTGTTIGTGLFGGTGTQAKLAQSFTADGSDIVSVDIHIGVNGGTPTDDVTAAIQADTAGSPSGTDLASATVVAPAASTWHTFTFPSSVATTNATTYWIVLSRTGLGSAINYRRWTTPNANPYAGGTAKNFNTGAWSTQPFDMKFVVNETYSMASTPVGRVTKTDTGTRAANFAFMGLLVDYTPAVVAPAMSFVPWIGDRF
jgi:hypothetical protein